MATSTPVRHSPVRSWLLDGETARRGNDHPGPHGEPAHHDQRRPWWKVMCLTGVDYFSTLGYQPGIAALAAGVISPIATLVLVALTLFGALPVYRRVARESPHGEGSIAMLERLLTFWKGKLFVLALLGFAATDFIITMTLSAADATAHLAENPHVPAALGDHRVATTMVLLALLGALFLRGFGEAIGVAVYLVAVYLALNLVVVAVGLWHVATGAHVIADWTQALTTAHSSPLAIVGVALLVFPKLALGLSGFETGVAVMPHVDGGPADTEEAPTGRVRGARKLLFTAAAIMSGYLVLTSLITTLLIPQQEFQPGQAANGRALAYLAHEYLGSGFGSVYDVSTICILWFAGASAMAGMLNLIPRYLPRYGMAPRWARATRPMVLVLTAIAFLITWVFHADVDAQGGAYATGVLVLITSASVAVTLAARRAGERGKAVGFGIVAAIFAYTTLANIAERPDGLKIGLLFVAAIMLVSFVSRLSRSFELRVTDVQFDELAQLFLRDCSRRRVRLVAIEPQARDAAQYRTKLREITKEHDLPDEDVVFIEVTVGDPSDFESAIRVHGEIAHREYRVLTLESSSVPNALAAVLLAARDLTGARPHIYFEWTEASPLANYLRFLLFGMGAIAPVTREVLREAEPDPTRRPHVHVG